MRKLIVVLAALAVASCKSTPPPAPTTLPEGAAPSVEKTPPPASPVQDKAKQAEEAAKAAGETAAPHVAHYPKMDVDEAALDRAVSPCDDFYSFACGGWIKNTPIPADRASWSRSFSEIYEQNEYILRGILDADAAAPKNDEADPYAQKVGDFWATCMDESKAETASLESLKQLLAGIDQVSDPTSLAREVARQQLGGSSALFEFGSQQDAKDATQVIGGADQGGLGLPDRDFYLKPDRKKVLDAYRTHVHDMLVLLGESEADATRDAGVVIEVETTLAKASMDRVERRDPYKVYHRVERKGLVKLAPHFPWDVYFTELGGGELQAINVAVPGFFQELDKLVVAGKWPELRTELRWHQLTSAVPALGKKFVEQNFRFTSQLTGAKEILPRWKRCVSMTDHALGEAVGRSFVARVFPGDSKPVAQEMVKQIEAAFEANLASLPWMDKPTSAQAVVKLRTLVNKIGYPDKWRNYDTLQIGRGSLLENLVAAAAFENKRDLAKIGKPVDRNEWGMTPAAVNAYYEASLNEMVFPSGILQPPFFALLAGLPANHGGIGMVMGHELTHGFDDQGRQFDEKGNLRDWWTKKSAKAYDERTACVVKQYDQYEAVEGVKLNGKLTLGENIADIGGLKLAGLALKRSLEGKPAPEKIAGFDAPQQFFLSFAQSWCSSYRPEMARLQAQTNEHSTPRWRVNGVVSDSPAFQEAFACKAGAPMAPLKRCEVW